VKESRSCLVLTAIFLSLSDVNQQTFLEFLLCIVSRVRCQLGFQQREDDGRCESLRLSFFSLASKVESSFPFVELVGPSTTMSTTLQLSQTAVPFPFGVLAAATFLNSQQDIDSNVDIDWERDGKLKFAGKETTEQDVLAQIGKSLKGQEVSSTLFISLG